MSALSNPQQFLQPSTMTVQQLQETMRQAVFTSLQEMEQQRIANEQAMQAANPPTHRPEFQKAIDAETKLIDAAIKGNPTLRSEFGKYDLDSAIKGEGGPALQQLAHRIDDHVTKVAGFGGDKDTPLSNQAAVTKAVQEGGRHYANLDMPVSEGTSFAAGVASGSTGSDSSASGVQPSDFDYEREGPQPDFQEPNAREVAEHFKSTVESHGGAYEATEPTIAEQSPPAGQEPTGFYDG